jgi:AraC family transcriptional regulator, regulatory protein of adaptative response / DNA-3-methyladenine glycosylase II
MPTPKPSIDANACYRALCAHDARFDGQFFTAVTSTGIYCRPVCRVRTPRFENCRFFEHAAQAEQAGFRPCLRCRPELAPLERHWSSEDAGAILVQQALQWLNDPQSWANAEESGKAIDRLARRLGVSDRHLRRLFDAHLGLSPLQYLLTRKLLTAKQLLSDTGLPMSQVALASGFASQRRFNAAFLAHYRLQPSRMRMQPGAERGGPKPDHKPVMLAWRPPLDAVALMRFFALRQITGLEWVELSSEPILRRTLQVEVADRVYAGWFSVRMLGQEHRAALHVSDGLQPVLPLIVARVRTMLDLNADPSAINNILNAAFPQGDGLRVPGCMDGFELATRAILGQQISVPAARTLAQRLVTQLGAPIETPHPELNRLFPSPAALASTAADTLGAIGIVKQRQKALQALARAVMDRELDLSPHADPQSTIEKLQLLPGIGPWTAQYIAMRALHWPDAWPVGDVALTKALGMANHRSKEAQRQAEALSMAWRPWRSYAVIRAWSSVQPPAIDRHQPSKAPQ